MGLNNRFMDILQVFDLWIKINDFVYYIGGLSFMLIMDKIIMWLDNLNEIFNFYSN